MEPSFVDRRAFLAAALTLSFTGCRPSQSEAPQLDLATATPSDLDALSGKTCVLRGVLSGGSSQFFPSMAMGSPSQTHYKYTLTAGVAGSPIAVEVLEIRPSAQKSSLQTGPAVVYGDLTKISENRYSLIFDKP